MANVLFALLLLQAAADGQGCGSEGCARDHTLLSVRTALHRSGEKPLKPSKGVVGAMLHEPEVEEVCGNPDGTAPDSGTEDNRSESKAGQDFYTDSYSQFQMTVSIEWCNNGCHQDHDPPHCVTDYSKIKARGVSSTQGRFTPWVREYDRESGDCRHWDGSTGWFAAEHSSNFYETVSSYMMTWDKFDAIELETETDDAGALDFVKLRVQATCTDGVCDPKPNWQGDWGQPDGGWWCLSTDPNDKIGYKSCRRRLRFYRDGRVVYWNW